MFFLDTNACIRILNGTCLPLVERLRSVSSSEVGLPSVVKAELLFGARKSARVAENLLLLERFFTPLRSIAFDDRCAEYYGMIRADLEQRGEPIGPNDLMIAASARAHDATLVTHDIAEFRRVVGLRVEDWEVV